MRLVIVSVAAVVVIFVSPVAAHAQGGEIRFGLTAVVVRENLRLFDRWAAYLTRRTGRSVSFVQRRSYQEITEMLAANEIQLAWICGYPFVRNRDPEYLELLAVPVFLGTPRYRSYVIVPSDSAYQDLRDLEGRVFAYSDPDSNSGYLVPRSILWQRSVNPDDYFRLTFFTYSHAETVQAVAERVADGGAVDSYVWEFLALNNPKMASRTRVIMQSGEFGFPPLVVRKDLDSQIRSRLREVLLGMTEDEEGRMLLNEMVLDGFVEGAPALYDSIRTLGRQYGEGVVATDNRFTTTGWRSPFDPH